jgi:hypothetical protein
MASDSHRDDQDARSTAMSKGEITLTGNTIWELLVNNGHSIIDFLHHLALFPNSLGLTFVNRKNIDHIS